VSAPASVDVKVITDLAPRGAGRAMVFGSREHWYPYLGSNTGRKSMPRLRYIEESEQTPHTRELIESARRTGAPDPRVVSLMTRSPLGIAWVEYWNKLLYQGMLPHKLKEMCRIKISVAHQCGYCSTVRSTVAKAEGLTEDMINDLFDHAGSKRFSEREKAALHYADLFKQGERSIDKDEVYADLATHFSDEEIIELGLFCAEVDGVGKFVKSLNVLSWEEACELNPKLNAGATPVAAE
jgi:AhpD family alkylhydroperoxidase